MRTFSFITVGKILQELADEGCKINRLTYYRLEKEGLFLSTKAVGGWRVYNRSEANIIKELIKDNFRKKGK